MNKQQCLGCDFFKEYDHPAKTVSFPHGRGSCCKLYCKNKMMCISKIQNCGNKRQEGKVEK